MKVRSMLCASACSLAVLSGAVQAAVVVGTYSFEETALVDQVASFTGNGVYDGSSYVNPVSSPANVTDTEPVAAPITSLQTVNSDGYRSGRCPGTRRALVVLLRCAGIDRIMSVKKLINSLACMASQCPHQERVSAE